MSKGKYAVAAAGLIVIAAIGFFFVREEVAWRVARENAEDGGYQSYLDGWPAGRHATEARAALDEANWRVASQSSDRELFEKYLAAFPSGAHVSEAQARVETFDWELARKSDEVAAYEAYLARHPTGPHIDAAKAAIADAHDWESANKIGRATAYESYLAKHPDGRRVEAAKVALRADVAREMVNLFTGHRGVGALIALDQVSELNEPSKKVLTTVSARTVEATLAHTGERLSAMNKFQFIIAVDGWYLHRQFRDPVFVATINERIKKLDKQTLATFQKAGNSNSPSLTCMAVAFQDYLFEGPNWKTGGPEAAVKRLRSIPAEAITRWETAIGKDHAWAVFSLLGVDSLFQENIFRPEVFDAVVPIAGQLLKQQSASKARK